MDIYQMSSLKCFYSSSVEIVISTGNFSDAFLMHV